MKKGYSYREFDEGTWEVYDIETQKRTAYFGDEGFAQEATRALNATYGITDCGTCDEIRTLLERK